jgi:predicted enzyme related to lactoylglutathione lyase
MPQPSFVILYVASPAASAEFYAALLGRPPLEASPTFVMFAFAEGVMLGLWVRSEVAPAVSAAPGGSEIAFTAPDVDAVYADWRRRGIRIAQAPEDMDFGRSFTALDPDGHRLRVFKPRER